MRLATASRCPSGHHVHIKKRLATADKKMFDATVLALQRENAELRIQVTEFTYGAKALNRLLQEVNDTELTEVCRCEGCYIAKRFSEWTRADLTQRLNKATRHEECILRKCLLWQCDKLGLTHEVYRYDDASLNDSDLDDDDDSSMDGWARVGALKDCHIVVIDKGDGLWEVVYGRKLKETELAVNPETEKLQSLFELLEFGEDFFVVDGVDYFTLADNSV